MKYSYCKRQIEGSKYCLEQCSHCQVYYAPVEIVALKWELNKIEKQLEKCRTSVLEDGWQTQRYAKKSRKWDVLAQKKMEILQQIEDYEQQGKV
jgi:hypothetical protein